MSKSAHKLKAQVLRRQGFSIKQIADKLEVAKSSVSVWCRDVRLKPEQVLNLKLNAVAAGKSGRLLGAKRNHDLKLEKVERYAHDGRIQTAILDKREALLVGAAVYWGEGTKKGQLSFVNSDKDMIIFMFKWFRDILNIPKTDFVLRVFINESHRSRRTIVEKYWATILGVPASQFRSTVFIKSVHKKKYENYSDYYGLLSIRVRRSTDLKYRILGLIEGLKYSTFR